MPNNSGYRGRDEEPSKVQPWDLIRIVPVVRGNGKTEDEWVRCGVLWQMKEREGFSWTMYFAIPEGARMAAMPRSSGNKNGGDR